MNKIKFALLSIIVLLILIFVYSVTYNFAEPKAYDFMVRHVLTKKLPFHNKQVYGSGDVVLVMIDAKTVEKLLLLLGFMKDRQKGSHVFYKHKDGRCTVLPFHSSKVISRPLMRKILMKSI